MAYLWAGVAGALFYVAFPAMNGWRRIALIFAVWAVAIAASYQ